MVRVGHTRRGAPTPGRARRQPGQARTSSHRMRRSLAKAVPVGTACSARTTPCEDGTAPSGPGRPRTWFEPCGPRASGAGASPVNKQSGKAASVPFRWTANTHARDALATFADNSRHPSPWAATLYWQARRRGKRHPQAVRILMRAWLRVMWACWHTNTPYQVNHHGAERRLIDQAAARP